MRQLKAIVLLPGSVAILVPSLILSLTSWTPGWSLGTLDIIPISAGGLLILLGTILWIKCVVLFSRTGKGTLAPWDPPRKLVVKGVYRHVRNPMLTGLLAILLGESVLFGSIFLLAWFILFLLSHLFFIVRTEEPALLRRFGTDYAAYTRNVPRWIPRLTPWEPP